METTEKPGNDQDYENLVPIFIRSDVDDLGLGLEAFRVYCHLARRANTANREAWPSYASIGEACFRGSLPKAKPDSLRRKAMKAVRELEALGLIHAERRTRGKMNQSNLYTVRKLGQWPAATRQKVRENRAQ